ncbi:hypothetical protein PTKIN_Ptkin05aG0182800 [Pterospermum kingtungense]
MEAVLSARQHFCAQPSDIFLSSSLKTAQPGSKPSLSPSSPEPPLMIPPTLYFPSYRMNVLRMLSIIALPLVIDMDPKDVFVSMRHFFARLMKSKHIEPLPLERALSYSLKDYPYMAENTAFYAEKLAEFIGYPFSIEEEEKGVVHKIARVCSFEYLRNLEGNKSGKVEVPWGLENNVLSKRKGRRLGKLFDKRDGCIFGFDNRAEV